MNTLGVGVVEQEMDDMLLSPIVTRSPRQHRHGAAAEDDGGQGTVFSSVVNLLATAMGAGILSLPQAIARCGWALGTVLIVVFAILADASLVFLVECGRASGHFSFEGIGGHYMQMRGKVMVKVALGLLLFGAVILMMIVIGDLLTASVVGFYTALAHHPPTSDVAKLLTSRSFVSAAAVAAMFPVTLLRDINALKYTSGAALLFLTYTVGLIVERFATEGTAVHASVVPVNVGQLADLRAVLSLPLFVSAFACQFNVLAIDYELKPGSKPYINTVIHIAIVGVAASVYVTGGLIGYLSYGAAVQGDLLEQFPETWPVKVAQLAIGLTNMFKIPLIVMPLRFTINQMFDKDKCNCSPLVLALETFALLGTCLVCALTLKTLSKELDLLGATAGALICLILPAAFYLKALSVHEQDGTLEQHFGRRGSCRLTCKRATAWFMLIAGSVLGIMSFSLTLYYWDSFS